MALADLDDRDSVRVCDGMEDVWQRAGELERELKLPVGCFFSAHGRYAHVATVHQPHGVSTHSRYHSPLKIVIASC